MYEQAFSPDKENDERSFDEICDEALKLFKSQCDNIHFKAIDDRDVELLSDDNGHNKYNVILIEHFRLLQSRHTTYKSMSQELYKYCVQYLHDMAKKYGYVIIVGMHINNTEEWLNNWMTMILRCVVDDEDVRYRYNFNDGDFSEYKQMIDDDYLI